MTHLDWCTDPDCRVDHDALARLEAIYEDDAINDHNGIEVV
jgi:hypothetical protein